MKTLCLAFCLAASLAVAGVIINPYRYVTGGGGPTAPSYANPGGTGDRSALITITQASANVFVNPNLLIDGNTSGAGSYLNGTPDGEWIRFDFATSKIIDEAKFYQSNSATHGTWKFQGSADASSWSDVGTSFTLGGSTLQTITELNGNTADFRYYRMIKVSGSTNGGPWTYCMEFKIGTP